MTPAAHVPDYAARFAAWTALAGLYQDRFHTQHWYDNPPVFIAAVCAVACFVEWGDRWLWPAKEK